MSALDSATDDQRDAFHLTMGPMAVDFATFAGMRISEQGSTPGTSRWSTPRMPRCWPSPCPS
jgi:hypothetical protein